MSEAENLDAFSTIAWAGFLDYAVRSKPIRLAYEQATGRDAPVGDGGMSAFVDWVTDQWWGLDETPEAYRKKRAEAKP